VETKGKEEEDDLYSLEVGEKKLGTLSQSESTFMAQEKGKKIIV